MPQNDSFGIVYVLTNPAIPGLVKIGQTERGSAEVRMAELYSTGVPVPFECEFAARVNNPDAVESALHQAFAPNRINPKREFFQIEPNQAVTVLRLVAIEDVTPAVRREAEQIDEQSREAAERLRSRRPNFNFSEMGMPIGAILRSVRNSDTVEVVSDRAVQYHGEELSLTRATKKMLGIEQNVAPGPYWTYEGRPLRDIYNETYGVPA